MPSEVLVLRNCKWMMAIFFWGGGGTALLTFLVCVDDLYWGGGCGGFSACFCLWFSHLLFVLYHEMKKLG